MIIEDIKITHHQASRRTVLLNRDGMISHRNHPKHVVPIHVHVVIVNLRHQAGRPNWAGIQVKSNKDERALVLPAIRPDESALAKAHVGLECQPRGVAGRGVRSGSSTANMR